MWIFSFTFFFFVPIELFDFSANIINHRIDSMFPILNCIELNVDDFFYGIIIIIIINEIQLNVSQMRWKEMIFFVVLFQKGITLNVLYFFCSFYLFVSWELFSRCLTKAEEKQNRIKKIIWLLLKVFFFIAIKCHIE